MRQLLFMLALLGVSSAYAGTGSQVVYLPNGGQSAIDGTYAMGPNYKDTANSDVEVKNTILGLSYLYGIDDGMILGGSIGNVTKTTDSTTTTAGLSDLTLNLRMNSSGLVYGADLGLPLVAAESDNGKLNGSSGGISLTPTVAYIMTTDSINYGAQGSYSYKMERTVKDKATSAETKTTGGSILTVSPFVEWNFGSGFVTGQFDYAMVGKQTVATVDVDSVTVNQFKVGGTYNFTESLTGLAHYAYATNSADDNKASTIDLGVRFVF